MRCKYCKKDFVKVAPRQRVCISSECLKRFSEEVKEKEWKLKRKKLKDELQTISDLTKIAQKYCNDFIRLRDTGKNCISCDKELKGKFDAGHYFNITYSNVRFNEFNIHGQCTVCNHRKHGNLLEYQVGLEKRIGGIELFELHIKAHEKRTYTKQELRDITEDYKKKIKNFKKK